MVRLRVLAALGILLICSPLQAQVDAVLDAVRAAVTYSSPSPVITSVTPVSGPETGGTVVTLIGTNLSGTLAVRFGNAYATNVVSSGDDFITCTAPAQSVGSVDITVSAQAGLGTKAAAFTYQPAPAPSPGLSLIAPDIGTTLGGTTVTLSGANLSGAYRVLFDGFDSPNIVSVTATSVICETPAHAAGVVSIAVFTPGGVASLPGAYTFDPPPPAPAITGSAPQGASTLGGSQVLILGAEFSGATQVNFGALAAPMFTVINDATISCITPAHAPGVVDISVTNAAGTGTLVNGFTFFVPAAPPSIQVNRGITGITFGGTDLIGYVPATGQSYVWTISNSGGQDLQLSTPVTLANLSNCNVAVVAQPVSTLAPGASTQLVLHVTPFLVGNCSFYVAIPNNDMSQNPFGWTVFGALDGPAPVAPKEEKEEEAGGCATRETAALNLGLLLALMALAARLRRRLSA